MSKFNILVKITGSIAAYKSAYMISRLVQDGNNVKVAASQSALKFIGPATIEGLTSNPVYTDSFEEGKMMSHINLVKWADITIVCPASANTINKLANGIGDNLITSLFLAHDWNKPYLLAPAMNTAMFNHPATQESFKKLSGWGVNILPTAEGYLACGDYGSGKLLEPDQIISQIYNSLNHKNSSKSVLITSGGTKESIDGIRNISNLSSGKTATAIANHFIINGYNVTYLCAPDAALPVGKFNKYEFADFVSLNEQLEKLLSNHSFDLVIHNAAVSDYSLHSLEAGNNIYNTPITNKVSSAEDFISLKLKKNFKIVDKIKEYSTNKNLNLISFKFTYNSNLSAREEQVKELISHSGSDIVVQNDFSDRNKNNVQQNFNIYNKSGKIDSVPSVTELAGKLEEIIFRISEL